MNLISQYDLTKYDKMALNGSEVPVATSPEVVTETQSNTTYVSEASIENRYKVGDELKNGKVVNQKGSFTSLDNAKKLADQTGTKVFDMTNGACIYPVQTTEKWYRVAKEYKNGVYVGQVAAYKSEANGLQAAKAAKLSLFDPEGKVLYSPSTTTASNTVSVASGDIYAVRKTFADTKTQLGLYSIFDNAKKMADSHAGYSVWDTTTKKAIYTPAQGDVTKFIARLRQMDEIVKSDIKNGKTWTYKNKNTSSLSKTFTAARSAGNRKTNCSTAVYWGLVESGVVGSDRKAIQWYGNGGFVWLNSHAKSDALKYFDLITVGNKTVKKCISDGTIQPGDIISYVGLGHTNVYLGNSQSFDSGHKNCSGSGEGAKFKCFISGTGYTGYKVAQILRLKNNGKQYRVQCGVYSVLENAKNYAAKCKEKGFEVIIINNDKSYIVQLGLFTNKSSADTLFNKAVKAGLSCSVVTI